MPVPPLDVGREIADNSLRPTKRGAVTLAGHDDIERLHAELAELRTSRARLVRAADADRRSIERELHGSVQQHLVALAMRLQLAQSALDSDPMRAKALLDEMSGDVQDAVDAAAQLAQRISPPLLGLGLAAALRAAAVSAGVSASVEVSEGPDRTPEILHTVYGCWLDALEHASDARPAITVRQDEHALAFEVVREAALDDALDALRDRVEALGGALTVQPEPEPPHSRLRLAAARTPALAALGQIQHDGLDPLVHSLLPREPELEEDRVDDLLDGAFGQDERLGDRGVVSALGHFPQHIPFSRRQLVQRRLVGPCALGNESVDDLRIHHGATLGHGAHGRDQLVDVLHALLQEVGAALASAFEEGERVTRRRVLAEHDDTDLRMRLTKPHRSLDPLVGLARWHANVGDDDVRRLVIDSREQRVEVVTDRDDLHLV